MKDIAYPENSERSNRIEHPKQLYARPPKFRMCRDYVWCNPSFPDNRMHSWKVEITDPPEYSRFEIWDRTDLARHITLTKDQLLSFGSYTVLSDTVIFEEPYAGPLEPPRIEIRGLRDGVILPDGYYSIAARVEAWFNVEPGIWRNLNPDDVIWNSSLDGLLSRRSTMVANVPDLSLGTHKSRQLSKGQKIKKREFM